MYKNRYVLTKKMCWEWAFIATNHRGIVFFLIAFFYFNRGSMTAFEFFDTVEMGAPSKRSLLPFYCLFIAGIILVQLLRYRKLLFNNSLGDNTEATYCVSLGTYLTITNETSMRSHSYEIRHVKRCIQTRKYLLLLLADNKMTLLRRDGFVNCSEAEFFVRLWGRGSTAKRGSVIRIALRAVLAAVIASTFLPLYY